MKKILITAISVYLLFMVCLFVLPTEASAAISGYYTYTVTNGEATITDCKTSISGSVTIPSTLGGYPVTTIGDHAFWNCDNLTSVTIPDSVTTIGDSAIRNCDSLTSITIPDSVTTIGKEAFYDCDSLTSITIPDSVTTIDKEAFSSCDSLTSITIPDSVTTIGERTFASCESLTSVTIGDSVTTIGYSAFEDCDSLTSVTIGDSVTTIDSHAFWTCDSLTSITIPDSVTTIGSYAFHDCSSLTSITIPDSVTTIGKDAFSSCDSLTSVTIGNSVTTIGDYAFWNCDSLTSVTIPDSVTTIGYSAFEDCDSLTGIWVDAKNPQYASDAYGVLFNKAKTELIQAPGGISDSYTIPDSVTTIGDYAFRYCSSLTGITIGDSVTTIGNGAFNDCSSLTSVTIGDRVTTIGSYAFRYCSSLTSVTIGDSVTTIGDYAFYGCDSLTSITIPDSVTIIGKYAFEECDSLTSVTIPDSVTTIGAHAFFYCDSLEKVIYSGTPDQWNKISIGYGNSPLWNAEIIYLHDCNENMGSDGFCDLCGAACQHSYVNGVCENCGAEDPDYQGTAVDANLKFYQTGLSFAEYIGVQPMVLASAVKGYDYYYVEAVQIKADGTQTFMLYPTKSTSSYSVYDLQMLPRAMTDGITLTVCAVKNGVTYRGVSVETSITELALDKLATYLEKDDLGACTVLVDMLNYGTEVQKAFNYKTNDVPGNYIGGYKMFGTSVDPTISGAVEISGSGIKVYANSLSMGSKVEVQFMFKTSNVAGCELRYTIGGQTYKVPASEFDTTVLNGYSVAIFAVKPRNFRDKMTIAIYNTTTNQPVSAVYTASIEDYAVGNMLTYSNLIPAMMKYGDAVLARFPG